MIISFTSEKGGVGKSTAAINFAVALVRKGNDVCLVDADKQQTVSNWVQHRQDAKEDSENLPEVHSVMKLDNIKTALIDLNKRYDYVVVDCAGRESKEMQTALLAADVSVIPLKCSQADLETLTKMQSLVESTKCYNDSLRVFVLRSLAPTNPVIKEERDIKEAIETYFEDLPVLESVLRDRKVYREAYAEGRGILEMDNDKASEEFNFFVEEVLSSGDKATSIPET